MEQNSATLDAKVLAAVKDKLREQFDKPILAQIRCHTITGRKMMMQIPKAPANNAAGIFNLIPIIYDDSIPKDVVKLVDRHGNTIESVYVGVRLVPKPALMQQS